MKTSRTYKWWVVSIIALFVATRFFIWIAKPTEFTEIIYSYMPYAHLWASGTRPYLDQWYEYPPATIPLFYLPHLIDMATLNTPIHIDYGNAYRGLMLFFDTAIFILLWLWLRTVAVKHSVRIIALAYYSLATAKAHHFIYDTMDITFAFSMFFAIVAPLLFTKQRWVGQYLGWVGYWLAIALKYINGPLGLIQAAMTARKNFIKTVVVIGLAGATIWFIPLFLYRSSIQVSLVYHQIRGLQIDSTAAMIPRTVTLFTNEESVVEVYKNYEITGPVSDIVLKSLDILFPIALISYILWASHLAWSKSSNMSSSEKQQLLLWLTLGYILVFMIFGKVLSRPFLLWHIPLVAALPFVSWRQSVPFVAISSLMVIGMMTGFPRIDKNWFISIGLIMGWLRVICTIVLFWLWERQVIARYYQKQ